MHCRSVMLIISMSLPSLKCQHATHGHARTTLHIFGCSMCSCTRPEEQYYRQQHHRSPPPPLTILHDDAPHTLTHTLSRAEEPGLLRLQSLVLNVRNERASEREDEWFKIQQEREEDEWFKIQQEREEDEWFKIQQERERERLTQNPAREREREERTRPGERARARSSHKEASLQRGGVNICGESVCVCERETHWWTVKRY